MNKDDILYTCEKLAGVFFIPVRLYDGDRYITAFGLGDAVIDPVRPFAGELYNSERQVSYYLTRFNQFYGAIAYGSHTIIIGPQGYNEYTRQDKRDYALLLGIDMNEFEQLDKKMRAIPKFGVPHFLHILLLINYIFNRKKLLYSDIATFISPTTAIIDEPSINNLITGDQIEQPPAEVHNMIHFERQMLSFVRMGDVRGLKQFFETHTHGTSGELSDNRVRHLKNFLVMSATLVSRAAIDGGLFEGEALELSNKYVRQSEALFSSDSVLDLLNRMVLDFTQRVFELGNAAPMSALISAVVSYIKNNISSPLEGQIISEQFHISRKTLSAKFKAETGTTLAEYVFSERINRAEKLLRHTDISLAEIADYLGFASQSHFQTRFRVAKGCTPLEFRGRI